MKPTERITLPTNFLFIVAPPSSVNCIQRLCFASHPETCNLSTTGSLFDELLNLHILCNISLASTKSLHILTCNPFLYFFYFAWNPIKVHENFSVLQQTFITKSNVVFHAIWVNHSQKF